MAIKGADKRQERTRSSAVNWDPDSCFDKIQGLLGRKHPGNPLPCPAGPEQAENADVEHIPHFQLLRLSALVHFQQS